YVLVVCSVVCEPSRRLCWCRAGNASKLDRIRSRVRDRGKLLVERCKSGQQRQQGFWRSGFDDEPLALFAHDRVFARKLELAGDAHRLVSPVLKELDMPLGNHRLLIPLAE